MWRQKFVQFVRIFRRQVGEFPAAFDQRIRRKHTRAAAISHNGQTRSGRARLFAEQLREIKQLFDCVDAQNAHATKSSIKHFVAACERAGMRGGSFRRQLRCGRP